MVPLFRSFIETRTRLQPQSCMQFAQCAQSNLVRAQWKPLQWKHTVPMLVSNSTVSLCTQVSGYSIKDSDTAASYPLVSMLAYTMLSSISQFSPQWIKSLKPSVGSSERLGG